MRTEAVRRRAPGASLLTRIVVANSAVVAIAVVVLLVSPATVSSPPALKEIALLVGGLAAIVVINAVLISRALSPLADLTRAMRNIDLLRPDQHIPVYGDEAEVIQLTQAFNTMLEGLRSERRQSVRRSLAAQESERRRIARELHDEVGQSLTAVVLQLERASRNLSQPMRQEITEAREAARSSLDEVRGIAQRLRPEALDDLGLASALVTLSKRVSDQAGLRIAHSVVADLGPVSPEAELVVYRVAQESLTNVVRHARASEAAMVLQANSDRLLLRVVDDGRGTDGARRGAGIQGMRERALMVGGELSVRSRAAGGTEVRLELPRGAAPS
jgi:two-component system sensor histidine kinase UhpB